MKIQIDTIAKTIKIEDGANLGKLFDFLEKILPEGEWGDFQLLTNVVISHWYPNVYPVWYDQPIMCTNGVSITHSGIGTNGLSESITTTATVLNYELN